LVGRGDCLDLPWRFHIRDAAHRPRVDGRALDTVHDLSHALDRAGAAVISSAGFTSEAFDQNQDYEQPLTLIGSKQMALWVEGRGHGPWRQ
jgi:hypothetical protein